MEEGGHPPLVLYDGVCGFCNRTVQFILKRDPDGEFNFASLQSGLAQGVLARHRANPSDLDTLYVVVNVDVTRTRDTQGAGGVETLLARSDAVLFALGRLGPVWRGLAGPCDYCRVGFATGATT